MRFALALLFAFSACLLPAKAETILFINGDVPYGTATSFSDTNDGLKATFTSAGFLAVPADYVPTSFGPEVVSDGPGYGSDIPLVIVFSQPVYSISMNFATDGSGPFDLTALGHGMVVGTASATGTIISSEFPEGTITFTSASSFNGIRLSSPDTPYFAVGNIAADTTPVPEPAFLAIPGILAMALLRRRVAR